MKRLTKQHYKKTDGYYMKCSEHCCKEDFSCEDCEKFDELVDRLAAIEDILGEEYDLDELREMVQAKREGRCVVLPCKVGDTVYRIGASICKWREIDRCDEYCDGWQYRDCWDGTRAVLDEKFNLCDVESVGKTVFLTREAAEAALKARGQDA